MKVTEGHCDDCCCARSWRALGVTEMDGRSIPQHIEALRAEVERLRWMLDTCINDNHIVYQEIRDAAKRNLERRWKERE